MAKGKNKIGFKVEPVKAKSGKGNAKPKAVSGKSLGFKGGKTYNYNYKKVSQPDDTKRFDKMSIVFFDTKILNEVTKMCLPKAGHSEFQVHYRALNVHISKGKFEVAVAIPTAYYNFKQEVTSGSVDYELDDIDNEADKVKEASDKNVAALIQKLPLFKALGQAGYEVSFKEGNFGSIHRHPGRFGFSSIDLGKDPEDPGVIYRQRVAKDFYQTDSVMYISGNECEIYTTEARIVNLEKADDGGVNGDYCQIPTISVIRPENTDVEISDPACEVLGHVDQDIFSKFHFVGAFGAEIKKYPVLEVMLEALYELDYEVDISNVVPDRITQKYSYVKGGAGKKYGNGYGNYYSGYGGSIYDEYEDYWGYDEYAYPYNQAKPANKKDNFSLYKNETVSDYDALLSEDLSSIPGMVQFVLGHHDVSGTDEEIEFIEKTLSANFYTDEILEILDYASAYAAFKGSF